MKKEVDLNDDQYEFEDFDMDLPPWPLDDSQNNGDRTPVEQVVDGMLAGVKSQVASPDAIKRMLTMTLPQGYSIALNEIDEGAKGIKDVYKVAVNELKPVRNYLRIKAKELSPDSKKKLPKFLRDKLEAFSNEDEYSFVARTDREIKEDSENYDIAQALKNVFEMQAAKETADNDEKRTDALIDKLVDVGQTNEQLKYLNGIAYGISSMVGYQDNVLINYHRKSLELQYRHFFVAKNTLDILSNNSQKTLSELASIVKNTALPDIVKMRSTELMGQLIAERMMTGTVQTAVDFIKNFKTKMVGQASDFIRGALGDKVSMFSTMQSMPGETGYSSTGNILGNALASEGTRFLSSKLAPLARSTPFIENMGGRLLGTFTNVPQKLNTWAQTETEGQGFKSSIIDSIKSIVPKFYLNDSLDISNRSLAQRANEPTHFDNMTWRTINEAIPSLLSEVVHWTKATATGEIDTDKTTWSHERGGVTTKANLLKDAKRMFVPTRENLALRRELTEFIDVIGAEEPIVTPDARKALMRQLLADSARNYAFDPVRYTKYESYKDSNASDDVIQELQTFFISKYDIDEIQGEISQDDNIRNKLGSDIYHFGKLSSFIPDVNAKVRSFSDLYGRDALRQLKLIERVGKQDRIKQSTVWDLMLEDLGDVDNIESLIKTQDQQRQEDIDAEGLGFNERLSRRISEERKKRKERDKIVLEASDDDVDVGYLGASPSITFLLNYLKNNPNATNPFIGPMPKVPSAANPLPTPDSFVGPTPLPTIQPKLNTFDFDELRSKPIPVTVVNEYLSVKKYKLEGDEETEEDCCERIVPAINGTGMSILERLDRNLILIQELVRLSALKTNPDVLNNNIPNIPLPPNTPSPVPANDKESSKRSMLTRAANATFNGTVWYAKKVFGIQKMLLGGAASVATLPFKKIGGGDVYVQGDEEPTLKASLMRRGFYTDVSTKKVIKNISDIKGPVINPKGETVLTQDEFDLGITESKGSSLVGMAAKGASKLVGGYFALATMPYRWAFNKTFGAKSVERIPDVYLKGSDEPKLKASELRKGRYIDYGTNKVIKSLKDITGEVRDINDKVIITEEEYRESDGLYDATGRKIISAKSNDIKSNIESSVLATGAKMLGGSVMGAMAVPFKFYGFLGNMMIDGLKSIFSSKKKGKEKLVIGESFDELLIINREQLIAIKNIERALIKKRITGDSDDDGIRDNSFEDLRRKEALEDKDPTIVVNTNDKKERDDSGHWGKLFGLIGTAIAAIGSVKDAILAFVKNKLLKDGLTSALDAMDDGPNGRESRGRGRVGTARKLLSYGRTALKVGLNVLPYTRVISAITFANHMKKASDGYGPLATMRMSQYGIEVGDSGVLSTLAHDVKNLNFIPFHGVSTNAEKILQLEEYLFSHVKKSPNGISFSQGALDGEEIYEIFEIDPEDKKRQQLFGSWFNKRFLKVFERHVLNTNTKTFDNIDKNISPSVALEYISNTSMLNQLEIFELMTSPYEDPNAINQGPNDVKAKVEAARSYYTKKRTTAKDAPVTKTLEDGSVLMTKSDLRVKETKTSDGIKLTEDKSNLNYIERLNKNLKDENYLGVALSLIGVGMIDDMSNVNNITIPQYVRIKTYGLEQLEMQRVNALLSLEDLVYRSVKYNNKGEALWSGNFEQISEKFSSKFSLGSVQERYNTFKWFEQRFLPAYLTYLTYFKQNTNVTPDKVDIKVKGNELKDLLKSVVNAKSPIDGKDVSVWDIKSFCYDDVKINEDKDGLLKYIDSLKNEDKILDVPSVENNPSAKSTNSIVDAYNSINNKAKDTWNNISEGASNLAASASAAIAGGYATSKQAIGGAYDTTKTAMADTYQGAKKTAVEGYQKANKIAHDVSEYVAKSASDFVKPIVDKKNRVLTAVNTKLPEYARALLDTIASTESPGYNVIYGGKKVDSLDKHPGIYVPIGRGPNAGKKSSAAGRYQFLEDTWIEESAKLGVKDFSPASQDAVAWNYAKNIYKSKTKRDLLSDISSGNPKLVSYAAGVLNKTWTSLPGGIETTTNPQKFFNTFNKSLENVRKYSPMMMAQNGAPTKAANDSGPKASAIDPSSPNQSPVKSNKDGGELTASNNVVPMFKDSSPSVGGLEAPASSPIETPISNTSLANAEGSVKPSEPYGLSKVSLSAPSPATAMSSLAPSISTPKVQATGISKVDLGTDVSMILTEQLTELIQIKEGIGDLINAVNGLSKSSINNSNNQNTQQQSTVEQPAPKQETVKAPPMRTASNLSDNGPMAKTPVSMDRTRYS